MQDSIETSAITAKGEEHALVQVERGYAPVYIWQTGRTLMLSKREKILADAYLETFSYAQAQKALEKAGAWRWKAHETCARWLRKQHVKDYIADRLKDRGYFNSWTKERWIRIATEHLTGDKRLKGGDLYCMKLIADVMGYDEVNKMNITQNTQINFTQEDGRE